MTMPTPVQRSSSSLGGFHQPLAHRSPAARILALATVMLGLALIPQGTGMAGAATPISPTGRVTAPALAPGLDLNQDFQTNPNDDLANPQAKQDASPPVPPLPTAIPEAVVPANEGIVGLTPGPEDNLGIGVLQPRNLDFLDRATWETNPLAYGRWLRSVALPLYVGPDGEHWGWMVNGWLIINGYEPMAIGRDASFSMVEARTGLYSFPVLEQRLDGWFRFQYTPAGSAWAHLDHLEVGAVALTLQPWEDTLATASHIRFRRHGLSQSLRTEPRGTASLQALVAPNSRIRPLAIDGDWMRVEVTQPVQGCTILPGHTTEEGWLRWRDEATQALLVWAVAVDCSEPGPESE